MEEDQDPISETLSNAKNLVPMALEKARSTTGLSVRWNSVISKLERVPPCLSDLSSHPCFAKNALCRELLLSVSATLTDAIDLADRSSRPFGKLQMQSDLDALAARLDFHLRDCAWLMKTGVLGDDASGRWEVQEVLARLQIGHAEAKYRAVDGLLEAMREDDKCVLAVISARGNVSALVQLLAALRLPR